ncbi:hypothetical protein SAMN05444161_7215 [Rhizobiales bacterium GAS191]|jgi:hypothetical protein|nr:hypothetical protein SAMN05519103_06564 [Rhizobiales bacterium GAS113]SED74075.1 hypothetical protein SAMN05519104_4235 [Rhizobiales bacterium GAS188]SEE80165.1 hypothetical protein SAMN05444161_7215 [Rhizobiales bacterium GAS191]
MDELNIARASKNVGIRPVVRAPARELSSPAVAYIALAVGGLLAVVWFVGFIWVFGLLLR